MILRQYKLINLNKHQIKVKLSSLKLKKSVRIIYKNSFAECRSQKLGVCLLYKY